MVTYKELLVQRETLDQRIAEARRAEVAAAIGQAKQLIAEYGLTAADCGFKGASALAGKTTRTTVAVKYRGPNGEAWSGRGKAPNWLTSLEANGRRRDEFLVSR